jgi:peroxiredoxin
MPKKRQAFITGSVCSRAWLYWLVVVGVLCGSAVFGLASATGASEEADRLGILSPPEKAVAPDFTLEDPSGTPVSLRDFRGKIVFVNFWATWCVPCRAEMPAMEHLYQEFRGQGLVLVAVNFKDGAEQVSAFGKELHLTFPLALDGKGAVASAYGVRGLPSTYLIDRDGHLIGQVIGGREWDSEDAKAYVRRLLTR